jgi:protease-4
MTPMPEDSATPPTKPSTDSDADRYWERNLITRVAFASLSEQRKARRWNVFFKLLLFIYLFLLLWLYAAPEEWFGDGLAGGGHTARVKLEGIIANDTEASAETVTESLRKAFEDNKTKGVILRVNSPGGSAVQSGQINGEIRRLREEYPDIPLYAVITDLCASGGYYVAAAADEIYADKASIVGSIGVISASFGFVETLDKLGVERRLQTAGEYKAMLDPFSPVDPVVREHLQTILDKIHGQFIDIVEMGRKEKLAEGADLFSGLVWTGEEAVKLGLADGIGSENYVAREVIGEEKIVDFTQKKDLWERLSERLGTAMGRALGDVLGGGLTLR